MGIDNDGLAFLEFALRSGVDFSSTCTIGRQRVTATGRSGFAEDLLEERFGAASVQSLDMSEYEGATLLHDLNSPTVPRELCERFSAVIDGGTLEHVFHATNGLRCLMNLVADGGHLLMINPVDGQAGHGFYQFGPEFYLRSLRPETGFRMRACLLRTGGVMQRWYEVPDPAELRRRVEPRSRQPSYLYVLAERVGAVPDHLDAQQSDYERAWTAAGRSSGGLVGAVGAAPAWVRRLGGAVVETAARWRGPRASGMRRVDISRSRR